MCFAGAVPQAPKAEDIKFKTKGDGYVSIEGQMLAYAGPWLYNVQKIKKLYKNVFWLTFYDSYVFVIVTNTEKGQSNLKETATIL